MFYLKEFEKQGGRKIDSSRKIQVINFNYSFKSRCSKENFNALIIWPQQILKAAFF